MRDGRNGLGFGFDFVAASPAATVLLVNVTIFAFSCLPPEVLMPALNSVRRPVAPAPPQGLSRVDAYGGPPATSAAAGTAAQPQEQLYTLGKTWCRTTPAIASCYSDDVVSVQDVEVPLGVYNGSDTVCGGGAAPPQHGGYTTRVLDSTVVCASPVSAECAPVQGYRACVLAQRQGLYQADDTWALLAAEGSAANASSNSSSGGVDGGGDGGAGGGGGIGGARLAGVVVGAVAGTAVVTASLAAVAVFCCWRQRPHGVERKYAAAEGRAPAAMKICVDGGSAAAAAGGADLCAGGGGAGGFAPPVAAAAAQAMGLDGAVPGVALAASVWRSQSADMCPATTQEVVRTVGEPYSQQCTDLPEHVPENYSEPYMDPGAMQSVRAWLTDQLAAPPPPPPDRTSVSHLADSLTA